MTPEASKHSGSRRIEFSLKSTTFSQLGVLRVPIFAKGSLGGASEPPGAQCPFTTIPGRPASKKAIPDCYMTTRRGDIYRPRREPYAGNLGGHVHATRLRRGVRLRAGEAQRHSPRSLIIVTGIRLHNSALIRPLEELLHSKCSTLRGELDSSTPRVFGVFWMVFVEGRSLPRKSVKIGRNR